MGTTESKELPVEPTEIVVSANGYNGLIDKAISSQLPVEQLKTLFELQERYEAGASRKAYVKAMCAFQQDCPTIKQSGRNSSLTFEGNKRSGCYADLRIDILPVVGRLCGLHGFIFKFDSQDNDGLTTVTCTVTHESGHSESSSFTGKVDTRENKRVSPTQKMGATLTYAQRQAIIMVFGLRVGDEDEDGLELPRDNPLIKADMIDELEQKIIEVGIELPKLMRYFSVESLAQISTAQYSEAENFIEKRRHSA